MSSSVHVALGERSYDIAIGTGCLRRAGQLLTSARVVQHVVLITDTNVERPHAAAVASSLDDCGCVVDLLVVEPGEPSKSFDLVGELLEKLLELGTSRQSVVAAVGGGVVGDLAGFVAATYARGLPLYQIPTTLLAQVDSSVGGKVGVNLPGAKNMVGAFWQPLAVCIDTGVLATLPEREYRAGLAEVVKYGVILDAEFFAYLEQHLPQIKARDPAVLETVIARCCRLKADVVEQDERELTGIRAVLNYGHTFCHAFETLTGYGTLLHGEAVSIGMECAARLSLALGRIDAEFVRRQHELLVALGLPVEVPNLDANEILDVMARDKKASQGRLRLVLPTQLGHVELVDQVDRDQVRAALNLT